MSNRIYNSEFRVGQRVQMTVDAIEAGLDSTRTGDKVTTGTVTYVPPKATARINVRRDHLNTSGHYHVSFWEPIEEDVTAGEGK